MIYDEVMLNTAVTWLPTMNEATCSQKHEELAIL